VDQLSGLAAGGVQLVDPVLAEDHHGLHRHVQQPARGDGVLGHLMPALLGA
jgi:hypothetical protein